MDNLKQYLQQHKKAMDVDEPTVAVWKHIEKAGAQKQPGKLLPLLIKFAAAAAVITAILFGLKYAFSKKETLIAVKEDSLPAGIIKKDSAKTLLAGSLSTTNETLKVLPAKEVIRKKQRTDERYAMMESFKQNYSQLVSYQLSSIRSTPVYAENPAYFDDFKNRLKQMDIDEVFIRKTIRKQGISNDLLEQLINVYQQKLDVLKSLQAEINKMNERVKQQPGVDSLSRYYLSI